MLLANIVGDFVLYSFFFITMICICAKKLICAVDGDDQIKNAAGHGVMRFIERFLK